MTAIFGLFLALVFSSAVVLGVMYLIVEKDKEYISNQSHQRDQAKVNS